MELTVSGDLGGFDAPYGSKLLFHKLLKWRLR